MGLGSRRLARLALAVAGAFLMVAWAPTSVEAGGFSRHGHRGHRIHHHRPVRHYPVWYRGHREVRHHRHGHHHGYSSRHHRRHYRSHRSYRTHRYNYTGAIRYSCRRCHHYYDSRHDFYDHLHHHHHVALVEIPHVIVETTLGWIFFF